MNEELKTIKLGDCLAHKYFIFEVEETHKGQKRIFYRIKQHQGYISRDWRKIADYETFEEAKAAIEEIRNAPTYKERAVF